ncbi:MAG: RHS repeat-associated core domain-containing protein [Bacteroidota bacterium]
MYVTGTRSQHPFYDINNQPVAIYKKSGGTCYNYYYDTQGNRIRKDAPILDYYVIGADGKTEAVIKFNNRQATHNIWGLDLVGQANRDKETWKHYYYIKDHLGSIRMTIDSTANIKSYDDFYPYGMVMENRSANIGQNDTRYKFTEKERDVETGIDYFGGRYYLPNVGQWISVDPLQGKYNNTSPYSYVHNNPVNRIDEDGLSDIVFHIKRRETTWLSAATIGDIQMTINGRYVLSGYTLELP